MRASSMRGDWLVGPTYIPENRYESDGWFCQNASMLRSRSGRRRKGLSSTVAPPITIWLPPPVAMMAAVIGEFFGGQPILARFLEEHCVDLFEFVPIARGRQVYFQNARIGSDAEGSQPRIGRRRVALEPHRLSADTGTYPRRRRPGRDSPQAWMHTAKTRAGGLLEPARKAMDGSAPSQFQPCSKERAADRPRDFSGRDPAAGSGVMEA